MGEDFKYEINGKIYEQRPLVWGQLRQMKALVKGFSFGGTTEDLIEILGEDLPKAVAIILVEKGTSLKNKDLSVLGEEFLEDLPLEVAVTVIKDFFVVNPIASWVEDMKKLVGEIQNRLDQIEKKTE